MYHVENFKILVREIIYSFRSIKSLKAEYIIFPLNNSEIRIRVRRAWTRIEPAYHKYRDRKDRPTHLVIGLRRDLRAIVQ